MWSIASVLPGIGSHCRVGHRPRGSAEQGITSPEQGLTCPFYHTHTPLKCLEPTILLVSHTEIAVFYSGKTRAEGKYHQSLDPALVLQCGWSGAGVSRQRKQKRKRARERRGRRPIPPSIIVHLLHATRLSTLFCLHMHSKFFLHFPRKWIGGAQRLGSECESQDGAGSWLGTPLWDPLLWPRASYHNSKNVWHKTCLGLILYRRLQFSHVKPFSFPGWKTHFSKSFFTAEMLHPSNLLVSLFCTHPNRSMSFLCSNP